MSPAVPTKGGANAEPAIEAENGEQAEFEQKGIGADQPLPAKVEAFVRAMADLQAKALSKSTWVGADFADKSRAMHYGETDDAIIHGKATAREAHELQEEGIAIAPLLFPVAAPDELN